MGEKYQRINVGSEVFVLIPEAEFNKLRTPRTIKGRIAAESVGDRIKAIREEYGLTEEEFAEEADMTQAQVSRLQSGQKPRAQTIEKVNTAINRIKTTRRPKTI